jgi:hypothetical protein
MGILSVGLVALAALIIETLCAKKKVKMKYAFLLSFLVVSAVFFCATLSLFFERLSKEGGFSIETFTMWFAMGVGIGIIAGAKCAFKSFDYNY